MSQDLSKPSNDPTVGKYEPKYTGEARVVADNEDIPNGAYDPKARYASEATIVKDEPAIAESDLTDIAKQLLSLDIGGEQPETVPTTEGETKDATPPTPDQPPELEYKPEDVDWTYLNMSQDFGVPDLTVNESDPEFQQWKEGFEKFLGHSWDDYKAARQDLRTARQIKADLEKDKHQRNLQKQADFIKQKWGVDDTEYHNRMQQVVAVFSKLDPATQAILDRDPAGALKIWKDIEMSQQINKPNVPQYEKSRPTTMSGTTAGKPMFTGSQISNMPQNQKAALWDKIMYASQKGLVDWSK